MKIFLPLLFVLMLSGCVKSEAPAPATPVETKNQSAETATINKVERVKIEKFFDYACTHCRSAHFTLKKLQAQFGDRVQIELKHFPLSPQTFLVAETAECARRQGKFNEYHVALIEENFLQYEPANLQAVAEAIGLDVEAFNTCAANGAGKSEVQADVDMATALGVKATPYFMLNDSIPVPGAIPEKSFARLIQQVLDGEVQ